MTHLAYAVTETVGDLQEASAFLVTLGGVSLIVATSIGVSFAMAGLSRLLTRVR